MKTIYELFIEAIQKPSDINQLLPIIYHYACNCETITEFGIRDGNSTLALLASKPKCLKSYDINKCDLKDILEEADREFLSFKFYQETNDLLIEIEPTDLLFIDTDHQYNQLWYELKLHSDKVNKYIIMHDTTSFADKDMNNGLTRNQWVELYKDVYPRINKSGLWTCIQDFLLEHTEWVLDSRLTINNGLTILRRLR